MTDTTKKLQDMTKVTKKLEEIKEYRNTRNVSTDNEFMIAIITNLLKNISVRSNPMHLLLNTYKEQKRKIDSNLEIAIGAYIYSLVTCWETFFRDLFIFISNNDNTIYKKLCAEVSETIPLGLTIGEFYARKYNFQNLNNTREAFDYIFQKKTQSIVDYFTDDIFNETVCCSFPLIFKWIQDGTFQDKVNNVLQTAFNIRHKVTHDANYVITYNHILFAEIECIFQIIPQFFISTIAAKYSQKRLVFNIKEYYVRITDSPTEFEKPYAFSIKDFLADDYSIVK